MNGKCKNKGTEIPYLKVPTMGFVAQKLLLTLSITVGFFSSWTAQMGEYQHTWFHTQPGEMLMPKSSFPEQVAKTSQVLYLVKN